MRKSLPSDLKDQRFGRLTVLGRGEDNISPRGMRRGQWLCKCDCGNVVLAMDNSLRAGYKKSCGCLLTGDNETQKMRDEFAKLSEKNATEKLLKQMKNDEIKKNYASDVLHIPLYEILYDKTTKEDIYGALDDFFLK